MLRAILKLLAAGSLCAGCLSAPAQEREPSPHRAEALTAASARFRGDGNYLRHLRVRLAPSDTKTFEAVLGECATSAAANEQTSGWLCYAEPPGRYWLVGTGFERDAPGLLASTDPIRALVASTQPDRERVAELQDQLQRLEMEVEWDTLHRRRSDWSSPIEMSPQTHGVARMIVRSLRAGHESAFADAVRARTQFLVDHAYPLPIEGFATLNGAPGTALQVVFCSDWSSFHGSQSFGLFVKTLSAEAQSDYAARKAALMTTMSRAEYYDGRLMDELSYLPPR